MQILFHLNQVAIRTGSDLMALHYSDKLKIQKGD